MTLPLQHAAKNPHSSRNLTVVYPSPHPAELCLCSYAPSLALHPTAVYRPYIYCLRVVRGVWGADTSPAVPHAKPDVIVERSDGARELGSRAMRSFTKVHHATSMCWPRATGPVP